jgi:hypothetical protein
MIWQVLRPAALTPGIPLAGGQLLPLASSVRPSLSLGPLALAGPSIDSAGSMDTAPVYRTYRTLLRDAASNSPVLSALGAGWSFLFIADARVRIELLLARRELGHIAHCLGFARNAAANSIFRD